ncbi:NUDIX hydrolase [Mergibacter septicus]|uniref:NUDIX hydrolase n=1 Tax=Mergibacter septicus TaxID=221402 RepID=UPI001179144D|nr:NUDIX hydrolase [Mergibacter septicus]AWX13859.1 NUDIX hydrolase [Mergibacter septicus]
MHKPHITLACVVHYQGKFLFVEEFEYGKMTLNQPAGHLEANESLVEGAERELFEETGIKAKMQSLLGIYQWQAPQSGIDYLRFIFIVELDQCLPTQPQDTDINRALWLTLEEVQEYIQQPNQCLRSPLVLDAIKDYLNGKKFPLTILQQY